MQFVYQFARHLVANHENTLLEDGFNSDLAANDVADASANGSPMQRQTVCQCSGKRFAKTAPNGLPMQTEQDMDSLERDIDVIRNANRLPAVCDSSPAATTAHGQKITANGSAHALANGSPTQRQMEKNN